MKIIEVLTMLMLLSKQTDDTGLVLGILKT